MRTVRLLCVVFFGLAVADAAHVAAQQSYVGSDEQPAMTDPLAKELERCKALHEQAASDPRCQAASKEINRRFFGSQQEYHPGKVEMFPNESRHPLVTDKPNPAPEK
jgi:conjugative transfer region protein TrbK